MTRQLMVPNDTMTIVEISERNKYVEMVCNIAHTDFFMSGRYHGDVKTTVTLLNSGRIAVDLVVLNEETRCIMSAKGNFSPEDFGMPESRRK